MKNTKEKTRRTNSDLPETFDDKKHLEPEETTLDLPEVKDIPGQEHIHVPNLKGYNDTTISSDDEEGVGIFEEDIDEDAEVVTTESNVTIEEKQALTEAAQQSGNVKDDQNLKRALLDNTDEDGEQLNEKINVSGSDLDVPGSNDDDENEEIGEEDEENNTYSLDGEDEDDSISKD